MDKDDIGDDDEVGSVSALYLRWRFYDGRNLTVLCQNRQILEHFVKFINVGSVKNRHNYVRHKIVS